MFPGCETLPGQSRENQDWWSHKSEGEDGLGARQVLQGGVLEHPLPPKAQSALLLRGLLLTRGWGHVLYLSVSKFCTEGMFLGD